MAITPTLLGPPEIYKSPPTATVVPATTPTTNGGGGGDLMVDKDISKSPPTASDIAAATTLNDRTGNPFIDLMVANFNNAAASNDKILTEQGSSTFASTGNPCLDFFFHVVPGTPPERLVELLEASWKHDQLKSLKLICNLRGVRGTGKADKEGFYYTALWLHKHHPKTLACNVASLASFGYFKDLPEILFRLLEGPDVRTLARSAWMERNYRKRYGSKMSCCGCGREPEGNDDANKTDDQMAALSRQEKKIMRAKRAVDRFNSDPDFMFLHDRVSDHFAECLKSDIKLLNSSGPPGDLSSKVSLAAKWCPSLDSSFDKMTLLCETIAKKVFPREEYKEEYEGIEEAHYAYRVRDRLRKQVLVPLRKALELPEVYMGARAWNSIPYNRVASVAMNSYKKKFMKHDKKRFREYLEDVKSGKAKIAAGALFPHEIINALEDDDGGKVAELQWRRMVDDMTKMGTLNNCLAISDVSFSMCGIPMSVSVALGILVSELSDEPWKGKLITFSANPELQIVKGDSLKEKNGFVRTMESEMNTNFQKVFDLILKVAVDGKLKGDEMIKRLFVFSDMEFDEASEVPWETDYEAIVRKFGESGYGDYVPEIVFWNLRDSRATPVLANQPGVALVSGFSKNLMKLFFEKGGVFDPETVMESAISGEEYSKLVVLD